MNRIKKLYALLLFCYFNVFTAHSLAMPWLLDLEVCAYSLLAIVRFPLTQICRIVHCIRAIVLHLLKVISFSESIFRLHHRIVVVATIPLIWP